VVHNEGSSVAVSSDTVAAATKAFDQRHIQLTSLRILSILIRVSWTVLGIKIGYTHPDDEVYVALARLTAP
jgi:hypothetical protein